MTFIKDGKFLLEENFNGSFLKASGNWNFTGKIGQDKNKECILLTISAVDSMKQTGLFNKLSTEFIHRITSLREDEIKIETRHPIVFPDEDGNKLSVSSKIVLN